jgi:hypothetical protein
VHVFRPSISDGSFAAGLSYTTLYIYIYIYIYKYIDACRSAPVVGPRSFVPVGHLKPCSKGSQRTHACTHTHTESVCVCTCTVCGQQEPRLLSVCFGLVVGVSRARPKQNVAAKHKESCGACTRCVVYRVCIYIYIYIYIYTLYSTTACVCETRENMGGPPHQTIMIYYYGVVVM